MVEAASPDEYTSILAQVAAELTGYPSGSRA